MLAFILSAAVVLFSASSLAATPVANPWIVQQRLSLYYDLLNATKYPPLFGANNDGNILWGLPLQFEWQNMSGRLMTTNGGVIYGESWWACMNYYLSVVPYLGAMNAGVVPYTVIQPPTDNNPSKFCLTPAGCNSTLIGKWTTYFSTVKSVIAGNVTKTIDDLMALLWDAHTYSIGVAMSLFVSELNYLPSKHEQKFGVGWGNFVEIIAAARFVTNATEVETMQVNLPYRMLLANDYPGFISDFTRDMNTACEAMFVIYDSHNSTAYELFLDSWKFAMKSPSCRADAQVFINKFFTNPAGEILVLLGEIITACTVNLKKQI